MFAPNCKQVDIYNKVARRVVESVLEGYNGITSLHNSSFNKYSIIYYLLELLIIDIQFINRMQ